MPGKDDKLQESIEITGVLMDKLLKMLEDSTDLHQALVQMENSVERIRREMDWVLARLRDESPTLPAKIAELERRASEHKEQSKNRIAIAIALIALAGTIVSAIFGMGNLC